MIVLVIALFCVLAFYFLPTIMALKRKSPHTTAVVIINFLFGFTLVGWIVALVLASKQPQPIVVIYSDPSQPRSS
jgi:RsiW-degrading membrane proteinase PrsW (M82 family)